MRKELNGTIFEIVKNEEGYDVYLVGLKDFFIDHCKDMQEINDLIFNWCFNN